jgi:hypothetical protein
MASVISVDLIDRTTATHQSSNNLEKEIGFQVGMKTMVQINRVYACILHDYKIFGPRQQRESCWICSLVRLRS